MSFSVWKNVKIKDVAETIFSGGTPSTKKEEFWNGKINWLSSGETRNKFIVDTEKKITQEGVDNSSTKLAKKKDVVIASAGQGFTRGQTSMCLIDTYINQSLICVRAKKDIIDPYYLFYNISSRYNELRQISDGHSIRGSLTTKLISDLNISLPTIDEQRKIREILFSIDNKIETNNEINKKLEEMAQAIFKQWFVDFEFPNEDGKPYKSSGGEMVESELGMIPKGWEVGSIYDVANVIYGAPFSSKKFNEDKIGLPLIRIRDLKTAKPSFYTEEKHKNATKVKTGDILVGMDAEFTPTIWRGNEGYLNQRVCMFKSNNDYLHDYFIYEIIKPYMNLMEFSKVGTTVIHLGKGDIDNMKIVIPDRDILKLFYKIIDPIYSKLIEVANENRILTDLRDKLLPKLMSGEIRVPID